jgi:hypothetical protein
MKGVAMDLAQDERRHSRRLSVRIPICTRPARSALPDRHADLLNISETGAYFVTWNRYAEGDLLDVSARIATRDAKQSPEWHYLARVVRVIGLDSRPLSYGVAVEFERDSQTGKGRLSMGKPRSRARGFSG